MGKAWVLGTGWEPRTVGGNHSCPYEVYPCSTGFLLQPRQRKRWRRAQVSEIPRRQRNSPSHLYKFKETNNRNLRPRQVTIDLQSISSETSISETFRIGNIILNVPTILSIYRLSKRCACTLPQPLTGCENETVLMFLR